MKKLLPFTLAVVILVLSLNLTGCEISFGGRGGNHGGLVVFTSDRNVMSSYGTNIFSMNLDGTNPTALTTDNDGTRNCCPVLSPDGTEVAFIRQKLNFPSWKPIYELCVMNVDGTNVKIIYSHIPPSSDSDPNIDTVLGVYPSWTPEGLIVFSEYHSRSAGCIKVITESGAILKTYSNDLNLVYVYSAPRVSPDGKKIVYNTGGPDGHTIYIADFDELDGSISNSTPIYSETNVDCMNPSWWWSQKRILIDKYDETTENSDIYWIEETGGAPTKFPNGENGYAPLFSHDGAKIIFNNYLDNEIYSINPDGSGRTNLTNNAAYDGYFSEE